MIESGCLMKADCISLVVAHGILAIVLGMSIRAVVRASLRRRRGSADLTVQRGEQSMNALYVLYGFATIAFGLAIDVADCLQGYKAAIVLLDYSIFTYLFFFNAWFRNSVVFAGLQRMQRD